MATVGIDIGTGSVRVCYRNSEKGIFESWSKPIHTHNIIGDVICQSSQDIYNSIQELIIEIPYNDIKGISTTATCSMVVMKISNTIGDNLQINPFEFRSSNSNDDKVYDILLWMDNSSTTQTIQLNETLSTPIKGRLGGQIIPELGIPKLKYLQDTYPTENFIVFELYDWINLRLTGIENKYQYKPVTTDKEGYAIDGSVKGWSQETLRGKFGVNNVKVGGGQLLPLGYPMGRFSTRGIDAVVAHGCIDCYAGWLSTIIKSESLDEEILSMVAGSSTCFIFSSQNQEQDPPFIHGIWGPFNIWGKKYNVYEFGQPATGLLFERLFKSYAELIHSHINTNDIGLIFKWIEDETVKIEEKLKKPINSIIKNDFYYGDINGNRSPLLDFTMSEIVIDGKNNTPELDHCSIINGKDVTSLIIKYNLILEFLCFQTKQILSEFLSDNLNVWKVIITGSQSSNERFLKLLSDIIHKPIIKIKSDTNNNTKYNVVKGASMIAEMAVKLSSKQYLIEDESYYEIMKQVINQANGYLIHEEVLPTNQLTSLYNIKYNIFLDMCNSQQKYRSLINSIE
ncbi:uncharacterized protein RJT21DRAFT_114850 [Scheffersomyces amazonensis]|uniref:uncharacterized protein n=1 Tax=Scheffersomyces amazonensis TaxID=1078765 RepID=UPI00315C7520